MVNKGKGNHPKMALIQEGIVLKPSRGLPDTPSGVPIE